ncbi:MAG: YeeE/YedE thiosulfate transporter family protein [Planctomycetota bacterium]
MLADLFASPSVLLLGALTGLVFGFLLQKGGVTRFDVILGQFLLRDFTMIRIMLTAVVVGGVGIYGMRALGLDVPLHVKNAALLGNAVGGLIFGVGMVILGYCPGTGVAAIGAGSRHAIVGVLGMLAGAWLYAEVHPWMKSTLLGTADLGKETLASLTGIGPLWLLLGTGGLVAFGLGRLARWERTRAAA